MGTALERLPLGRTVRHKEPRLPSRIARGRLAALSLFCLAATGCSFLYDHRAESPYFVAYSNRNRGFVERTARRLENIYEAYTKLFGVERAALGRATVLLEGEDSTVVDHGYSPSLLGYYVPLFNVISIDTSALSSRDEASLEQVLLHEVAHHFIVTEYPRASSECWLNEGLAGALEVSRIRGNRAEYPLLNPVLLEIARKRLFDPGPKPSLSRLLSLDWHEFHRSEAKESYYALAWSVVYFLLEVDAPRNLRLGERIERLYSMDRERIVKLEDRWLAFLRTFDLGSELLALGRSGREDRRLTAEWALSQIGESPATCDLSTLRGLVPLIEEGDAVRRVLAARAFLRILEKNPALRLAAPGLVARGAENVSSILRDRDLEVTRRAEVLDEVGRIAGRSPPELLPVLIELLESPEAGLRAAAAGALSRGGLKPTIVNPDFWRLAPVSLREREVGEWRRWLRLQLADPQI